MDWKEEIRERTKKIPVYGGHSEKWNKVGFDDLIFVPGQLAKRPVDYYQEEISSETIIGKNSKKPIVLKTPIIISAMSFGALSKEAKIALAKASTLAGTITNTGEGGMLKEEREAANKLIVQYSTGRFGISEEVLKQADAIEIKIGQGAKPGMGGLLPKEKVTEEIAQVRNIPLGIDVHSPAYHQDIKSIDDLKKRVRWLRELTGGVPIIIKLAAGDIENDLKMALKADPDIIAIDGMEGATGASPEIVLNEVGIPTLAGLVRARKFLDKKGARQELWVGGGLRTAKDFIKALALGADAVFCATSFLIAMGCIYCRLCHLGRCPAGLTTQDPELRKKLNVDEAVMKVVNFINNSTEEMKMIAGCCGENKLSSLKKYHLRALTWEAARISGVKFISDA